MGKKGEFHIIATGDKSKAWWKREEDILLVFILREAYKFYSFLFQIKYEAIRRLRRTIYISGCKLGNPNFNAKNFYYYKI